MNRRQRRAQRNKGRQGGPGTPADAVRSLLERGFRNHQQGRLREAEESYRQALRAEPGNADALNLLAIIADSAGRAEEALALMEKAVAAQPANPQLSNNLGQLYRNRGRVEDAVETYRKALRADPNFAEAHSNLGNALHDLGRLDDAVASYRKALAIAPDYAPAHNNLGTALSDLGRLDDAVASYRRAIAGEPGYAEAHSNLGNALLAQGRPEDAAASYREAIAIRPDFAEAHSNLGNALLELGRLDDAAASCRAALAINSGLAKAHNNLGNALARLERLDDAIASYRRAIAIKPDYAEAYVNLAAALHDQGAVDEAAGEIDKALAVEPQRSGWRIRKALLLPIIPSSENDIDVRREALRKELSAMLDRDLAVADPAKDIGTTNFRLAYHERDDRRLVEDIARIHIKACPGLTYEAKHCRRGSKRRRDVLRIGFVSSFLRGHTIGKLNRGIIQNLSRDLFEVVVFRPPGPRDEISDIIDNAADRVVPLGGRPETDRETIGDEEPDILYYTDIGMDPYTYYLAFARLAPVQIVTWGHPDTTGIPNVDYFLSWRLAEPPGASKYYSEQLIQLPYLTSYYYRPEVPETEFSRGDYGLSNGLRLYACPQTLFKFHPCFDGVLGELLRRDPDGCLVLIDDGKEGRWQKLLTERFARAFPDAAERVVFIPTMSYEKFLGLLRLADAILDIPTFSGGNSSLEAFGAGAPIVTWPGKFLRGRLTTACYKQMKLDGLVAADAESYVALALRLARDDDFKRRMADAIAANADKLFERDESVRQMESFFTAAHAAWRKGEVLKRP